MITAVDTSALLDIFLDDPAFAPADGPHPVALAVVRAGARPAVFPTFSGGVFLLFFHYASPNPAVFTDGLAPKAREPVTRELRLRSGATASGLVKNSG